MAQQSNAKLMVAATKITYADVTNKKSETRRTWEFKSWDFRKCRQN